MSITWMTPPAQAISSFSSSGLKIGTNVWTSAGCTSPIVGTLLAKMSPGRIFGLSSQPLRTMYLIASDIVWTCTMIPVDSAIESPSGVYSANVISPSSRTIGEAEMFIAVSRADTIPPRTRENSFSKCSGSDSLSGMRSRPW